MSHSSIERDVHIVRRSVTRAGVRMERSVVVREVPSKQVVRSEETVRTIVRNVGPPGPPGADGTGDANYLHHQDTPATVWTINHGLGKYPSITFFDSLGRRIETAYTHTNMNQAVATFGAATGGTAPCN